MRNPLECWVVGLSSFVAPRNAVQYNVNIALIRRAKRLNDENGHARSWRCEMGEAPSPLAWRAWNLTNRLFWKNNKRMLPVYSAQQDGNQHGSAKDILRLTVTTTNLTRTISNYLSLEIVLRIFIPYFMRSFAFLYLRSPQFNWITTRTATGEPLH